MNTLKAVVNKNTKEVIIEFTNEFKSFETLVDKFNFTEYKNDTHLIFGFYSEEEGCRCVSVICTKYGVLDAVKQYDCDFDNVFKIHEVIK